jgi:signal recognition particle subunit SRP54
MGLFSSLSEKISNAFAKLTRKGKLTEADIKEAMREVRVALLEADVNYLVVKKLINSITEKAVGEKVLKSLTPGQQVIKIVNEELTNIMGGANSKLAVASNPPTIILMCGLQGAGKTTMCGKLGLNLRKQGKKPLLVACDIYRPAAIEQLQVVAKSINLPVFEKGTQDPVKTSKEAVEFAKQHGYDTVIIDTAGRLQINQELMDELKNIKKAVNPTEILLTVDSMTGQEAVNVSETFNNELDITGVILTKLDGDTRGGAALSISYVVQKPIKFCGIGEKMSDLEPFYPDRMASRILGMGDVLTLIEKAEQAVSKEEAEQLEKKFRENSFTFEDYLAQLENLKKMGGLQSIIGMLPGMGALKNMQIDEKQLLKNKAIIQSMTPKERIYPETIKSSNRQRIAKGSGVTIQEVNQLIKQFEQTKELMRQMKNRKGFGKMPFNIG